MIIRYIKLNILPVQNESVNPVTYGTGYYKFEQKIIFILSSAETVENRNFWKQ